MTKSLCLLTCIFGVLCMGTVQGLALSPGPSADALIAKATWSGTCQVVCDATGHVASIVMTRSTGSKKLDDNALSYGRKFWIGQPNATYWVPIYYTPTPAEKPKGITVRVTVSDPPYPYQARAKHLQGSGSVRVTFDESGKAISAKMEKSTGSSILDDQSVNYALAHWKSSGGKKTTVSVPVAYRLQ